MTLAKLEGTVYHGREGVAAWKAWWLHGRRGGGREGVAAGAWASIGSTIRKQRVDICVQLTFSFFFSPGPQPRGLY